MMRQWDVAIAKVERVARGEAWAVLNAAVEGRWQKHSSSFIKRQGRSSLRRLAM